MIDGLNHLALSVSDMKRTLEFYTGVLGLRLDGLFPMHGVPGAVHAFLDLGDGRQLSFIRFRAPKDRVEGLTYPAHPGRSSAVGTMHHVALNVRDEATLLAVRDRVLASGRPVAGPIDHGFCRSIYFKGPDEEQLEVSWFTRALGAEEMNAATLRAVGISAAELATMSGGKA